MYKYDLRSCLEAIIKSSVPDMAWLQATLPIRLGGLGLRQDCRSSVTAFIGSCNATRQLSEQLLCKEHQEYPPPGVDSSFCVPGEQPARDLLQKLIAGHAPDPNIDDQHHLQALLDSDLWSSLKDDSSLRDRGRINTISAQHAGA